MNEEQEKLVREFGGICRSKGIDADLIIMAGTIAFGDYAVDNGKEEEIMKDLIEFVKKVKEKGNQEFFEYMYKTYVSKMPDQTVYDSADSDKEDSIEQFAAPTKEMVNKFEKMLKDAGMTDKNVKEACEISCAYYYFFDAKGEPSDEGKETIEIFKYRFGDEKKEQVFMELLYRISGESPTNKER